MKKQHMQTLLCCKVEATPSWLPISYDADSQRESGKVALMGIEMVSVCTGLLGEEGRVSTLVDTRL